MRMIASEPESKRCSDPSHPQNHRRGLSPMVRLSDESGDEIVTTHVIVMTRCAHRHSMSALRKTKELYEESSMTKTTTWMDSPISRLEVELSQ